MKKIYYLFFSLMLAVVPLVLFTSCGDDDYGDEPSSSSGIVGTWEASGEWLDLVHGIEEDLTDEESKSWQLIQFRKDGTVVEVDYGIDADNSEFDYETSKYIIKYAITKLHGTYKVSGNKVTITTTDEDGSNTYSYTYKVSGSSMTITFTGFGITGNYKRVSDSKIAPYLD